MSETPKAREYEPNNTIMEKSIIRANVQFYIDPLEEITPISEGLGFEFTGADHSEYINKVEADNGFNPWLWCTVRVTARLQTLEGFAYLSQCPYNSKEDFIGGGYYEQMQDEAFEELYNKIVDLQKVICVAHV